MSIQVDISRYVQIENYKAVECRDFTNVQRDIVKRVIVDHPEGITDFEICIQTGFSRSSVTARRNEIPGVRAIGIAKIQDDTGDRLNTLWSVIE